MNIPIVRLNSVLNISIPARFYRTAIRAMFLGCFFEFFYLVFWVGLMLYLVCYVCSSRMRVLNNQSNCAICKQEMEMVVFHDSIFDYGSINLTSLSKESEFGIAFFTQDSKTKFQELLLEKCTICKGDKECVAADAKDLKLHMSRKHTLFSCQLCTDNYLLFPREYLPRETLSNIPFSSDTF